MWWCPCLPALMSESCSTACLDIGIKANWALQFSVAVYVSYSSSTGQFSVWGLAVSVRCTPKDLQCLDVDFVQRHQFNRINPGVLSTKEHQMTQQWEFHCQPLSRTAVIKINLLLQCQRPLNECWSRRCRASTTLVNDCYNIHKCNDVCRRRVPFLVISFYSVPEFIQLFISGIQ